jgi:hypothetical protein
MLLTLPSISVTFGSRGKDEAEKKPTAERALHATYTFDPVLAVMLVTIVLLSGAVLVYAARS